MTIGTYPLSRGKADISTRPLRFEKSLGRTFLGALGPGGEGSESKQPNHFSLWSESLRTRCLGVHLQYRQQP